jgi:hypothetical protein
MAKLPKGHPISAHKDIVGQTMHRWKHHDPKPLHSGVGKKGKEGKVVTDQDQAIAIALSVAGKGKSNHSERLQSIGYSEETADAVAAMLDFAELDWAKQFDSGKGPGPEKPDNYHTGIDPNAGRGQLTITKGKGHPKGDMHKLKVNSDAEMLAPVAYPRGPANPQGGSSKEVQGLRMLG